MFLVTFDCHVCCHDKIVSPCGNYKGMGLSWLSAIFFDLFILLVFEQTIGMRGRLNTISLLSAPFHSIFWQCFFFLSIKLFFSLANE